MKKEQDIILELNQLAEAECLDKLTKAQRLEAYHKRLALQWALDDYRHPTPAPSEWFFNFASHPFYYQP